jgi:hypothetical protein
VVKWISIVGYVAVSAGVFLGFYYLGEDVEKSLAIVTVMTAGVEGVLGFVRHYFFYKSDMKRLGWETDRPDWVWEVGFANLGFGAMALLTVVAGWGVKAQAAVLLGYSLYLFQAAMLHLYRYLTDETRSPARLWRAVMLTLVIVVMMAFFAIYALLAQGG